MSAASALADRGTFDAVVVGGGHNGLTEAGTHNELMAADGLYADLYAMQAAAYS